MNHLFVDYSTSHSNSDDQSRSPVTLSSSRLEVLAGMNRDRSVLDDNDDASSSKMNDKVAMVPLHEDFVPGANDVICGRGKKCYAHAGNEKFRQIVQSYLERYSAASSRPEKSEILSTIVSEVRRNSPDGGFVKQDTETGKWCEVGDFLAREKTSQAFRDALHEHYRSSKKSKHEKRRQRTKAKAQSEKQQVSSSSSSKPVVAIPTTLKASRPQGVVSEVGTPNDHHQQQQTQYPPLDATPFSSRQQLTVLREEPPPSHPRAYSFSGHTQQESRVREAPSRASSLSSGRSSGGRIFDSRSAREYRGQQQQQQQQPYQQRAESAPGRYIDDEITLEEIAAFRNEEQRVDPLFESWPQTFPGNSNNRHYFNPPPFLHASAPQFHPVREEDVVAHSRTRSYHLDTDAIMAEAESGAVLRPPMGVPSYRSAHHHWSTAAAAPGGMMGAGEGSHDDDGTGRGSTSVSQMTPFSAYHSDRADVNTFSADHAVRYDASLQSSNTSSRSTTTAAAVGRGAQHLRTDSTASATAIVAQLESALPPDPLLLSDDNPFEPIPLGSRQKKPRTEGGDRGKW